MKEIDRLAGAGEQTQVGSVFVSNYPPFSIWTKEDVERAARPALEQKSVPGVPLGLYLHIPFCRKRCHFCYFRVYTDKNAEEVENYIDLLVREMELYSRTPVVAGRDVNFVYFGGGTPSFLSSQQLKGLVTRLKAALPWKEAEEITFECEPGTLTETKLSTIRDLGVTRLSLGIENFDDRILEINGRAHRSGEVFRAYERARKLGFPQINIASRVAEGGLVAVAFLPPRARRDSLHVIVSEHRLKRRVEFSETDLAGFVHFTCFFRYMEEAEHALWREAGLSIVPSDPEIGFPRLATSFEYFRPLKFEAEFEIWMRIAEITDKTMPYSCVLMKDDERVAVGGSMRGVVKRNISPPAGHPDDETCLGNQPYLR